MTARTSSICRVLLACVTAVVLLAGFYPAVLALVYALYPTATFEPPTAGSVGVLAYAAFFVFLVGLLPIRGRPAFYLGVVGTLLLLPAVVVYALLSAEAAWASVAGLLYLSAWWFFSWPKIAPSPPTPAETTHR